MKKGFINKGFQSGRCFEIVCALLIAACLCAGGCADGDDDTETGSLWYTHTGLCPDGTYSDTQEQYLTNSMYQLLGMLEEYISRFNYYTGEPHPDRVERFYTSEGDSADYFEELIQEYLQECQVPFEYTRAVGPQGIIFSSTDLSAIVNSFYIKVTDHIATLDRNVFCEASEEDMLAYIEGAYMRYGIENESLIEMANAWLIMETVGYVLKELGCSHIAIFDTGATGAAPTVYAVIFEPSELVAHRLDIQRIVTEADIAGTGEYALYLRID
jgi:hypothetical protein